MLIVTVNLGSETYSGYAALVAGWGNVALVDKPPQEIILSPLFKAIGKYYLDYHLRSLAHSSDSGIVCPELLRLAHLGLLAANDRRQSILCTHGLGWLSTSSHI
jgi:hypothetical protein